MEIRVLISSVCSWSFEIVTIFSGSIQKWKDRFTEKLRNEENLQQLEENN